MGKEDSRMPQRTVNHVRGVPDAQEDERHAQSAGQRRMKARSEVEKTEKGLSSGLQTTRTSARKWTSEPEVQREQWTAKELQRAKAESWAQETRYWVR